MRPTAASTSRAALAAYWLAAATTCRCDSGSAFVVAPSTSPPGRTPAVGPRRPRPRPFPRPRRRRQPKEEAGLPPLAPFASPASSSSDGWQSRRSPQDEALADWALVRADEFLDAHPGLESLPALRRHSGDAAVQRTIEVVRRAVAAHFLSQTMMTTGNIADNASTEEANANANARSGGAGEAEEGARGALTDYLEGLSSGRLVATPGSAAAAATIRSYLGGAHRADGSGAYHGTTPAPYMYPYDRGGDDDDDDDDGSGMGTVTTVTVDSATHVHNLGALAQNLPSPGEEEAAVIARSVHEEEQEGTGGGTTTTETTVTREGPGGDTVVTITSTTRIILPPEALAG
jgi:hypothetical protein